MKRRQNILLCAMSGVSMAAALEGSRLAAQGAPLLAYSRVAIPLLLAVLIALLVSRRWLTEEARAQPGK